MNKDHYAPIDIANDLEDESNAAMDADNLAKE
jgi:hypothetical protein